MPFYGLGFWEDVISFFLGKIHSSFLDKPPLEKTGEANLLRGGFFFPGGLNPKS